MVLFQNDPFREMNAAFNRMAGRSRANSGTSSMPMDAYRRGGDVWVHLDLPGESADSIDIGLERNVLTVTAQRDWDARDDDQIYIAERSRGVFSRQVHIGDSLDAEQIEADYQDGVLTLRIPIAEQAQPRRIKINTGSDAIDISSDS